MPLDLKGRLFLPSKHKFKANEDVDYGDNWRGLEAWSKPVWQGLKLINTWQDWTVAVNSTFGFPPPQFCVNGFGELRLRGIITNATAANVGLPIANLPPGYSPPYRDDCAVMGQFTGSGVVAYRLEVTQAGAIQIVNGPGAFTCSFIFLSGYCTSLWKA